MHCKIHKLNKMRDIMIGGKPLWHCDKCDEDGKYDGIPKRLTKEQKNEILEAIKEDNKNITQNIDMMSEDWFDQLDSLFVYKGNYYHVIVENV